MTDRKQDMRVAEILGMRQEIAMSQNAMLTYSVEKEIFVTLLKAGIKTS